LRRIAEARSLDRSNLQGPAQLVHHQGGEKGASPSTSSAMINKRATSLATFSSSEHVLQARDFLLVNEDVGFSSAASIGFRVGNEVGREITFVELHTFATSKVV